MALIRYECITWLARRFTNELVVTSVGNVGRELYAANHRSGQLYNFYMGGASAVALGMALALPHRRVISLEGDGAMLMYPSVLSAIGNAAPKNLMLIVFDNECYAVAWEVPTFTANSTDIVTLGKGAGIQNSMSVMTLNEFHSAVETCWDDKGPSLIVTKVDKQYPNLSNPRLDASENKYRFIRYIEETENIAIITEPLQKGKYSDHRV